MVPFVRLPKSIVTIYRMILNHIDYINEQPSRDALSYVLDKYHPKLWYFGHMHIYDQNIYNGCKWTCLSGIGMDQKWWIPLDEE